MKKYVLGFALLLMSFAGYAQSVVFEDHFYSNSNNWFTGDSDVANGYMQDGMYYIRCKEEDGGRIFENKSSLNGSKDFTIEASLTKLWGPENKGFGLVLGSYSSSGRYYFYITQNGYYYLKYPSGWNNGWVTTSYVNKYGENKLKIVKKGNDLQYYLNGHYMAQGDYASSMVHDKIGFVVYGNSQVKVDYVKVSETSAYQANTNYQANSNSKSKSFSFGKSDNSSGKTFSFYNLEKLIREYVEKEFAQWAVKDEFETSEQYRNRIAQKDQVVKRFTQQAIEHYRDKYLEDINLNDFTVHTYDADAQTFKITLNKLGDFYLFVPLSEARNFKANQASVNFKNIDLKIKDNQWMLSYLEAYDSRTYRTYAYDITKAPDYNPVAYNPNISGLNVEIPQMDEETVANVGNRGTITQHTIELGDPDVDLNIPQTNKSKANTFALIIGNEDYTKHNVSLNANSNVDYARRDAKFFREYAIKTLGIPEENVSLITDAISSVTRREINRIVKMASVKQGELIFYYAGHGFPDPKTKDAYLIPVDVIAEEVSTNGIKLSDLYAQLAEPGIQKTTVFLDACFSGGGRNQGLIADSRFAVVKPNKDRLKGNIVVFSASSNDEVSKPYQEKKHGLFTYFLLKKLQETKGEVSYKELYDYLQREVSFNSAKNYSKQNPEVNVSLEADDWEDWKF
jgi:hypothetical protein